MENSRCCYVGTVAEFQNLNEDDWKDYMIHRFHQVYPDFPLDEDENRGQVKAWKNCFKVMQKALASAKHPDTNYIVFEYKLPYEGGRRPDVRHLWWCSSLKIGIAIMSPRLTSSLAIKGTQKNTTLLLVVKKYIRSSY